MNVAAYQGPLLDAGSTAAVGLMREQVHWCESAGVDFLCCPEAFLGGLADDADRPEALALNVQSGQLLEMLSPLTSETVTTIVGFTEIDAQGRLFNAAAVLHRGSIAGVYRKHHTAINRSVYTAGQSAPVFTIGGLTFGIIICRDSRFQEPAATLAARGATTLFVPTNNALACSKTKPDIVDETRRDDIARATANEVTVVRADVAGRTATRVSYGTSGIVGPDGAFCRSAPPLMPALLMATVETDRRQPRAPAAG